MTTVHVGIDWSGAADRSTQRRHVATAVVRDGEVVELGGGRTRSEAVDHLLDLAGRDDRVSSVVVGLDFGFAFPRGLTRRWPDLAAPGVWADLADDLDGDGWFGPRSTLTGPAVDVQAFHDGHARVDGRFRRTELALRAAFPHLRPKPTVDLRGVIPGHVGRQSVRGMGHLARLRDAGVAIWPWDPWPGTRASSSRVAVEAYPAALRDPAVCPHVAEDPRLAAAPSEHARDALAIALALARHADGPRLDLGQADHDGEGAIWVPACAGCRT